MYVLDEKDCVVLDMLQQDCRVSLTEISKKINLSVDAVNKRIKKMIENNVFYPKIQLRPRNFGFANIVEAKVKLQNHTQQDVEEFITYLQQHPRLAEIFTISGESDLSLVMIAKDTLDLAKLTREIRGKYGQIIGSWNESLTVDCHKFEQYNMQELYNHINEKNYQ